MTQRVRMFGVSRCIVRMRVLRRSLAESPSYVRQRTFNYSDVDL